MSPDGLSPEALGYVLQMSAFERAS